MAATENKFSALCMDSDDETSGPIKLRPSLISEQAVKTASARGEAFGGATTNELLAALPDLGGVDEDDEVSASKGLEDAHAVKWGGEESGLLGGMASALAALKGTPGPSSESASTTDTHNGASSNPFLSLGKRRQRAHDTSEDGTFAGMSGLAEAAMTAAEADGSTSWGFQNMLTEALQEAESAEQALQQEMLKRLERAHETDQEVKAMSVMRQRLRASRKKAMLRDADVVRALEKTAAPAAKQSKRLSRREQRLRAKRVVKSLY
jgi:hypothetical protein